MEKQKTNNPPVVAIVGRPNVGKSAIFNRLAGRRISIVHDHPGVTRDRITTTVKLGDSEVQMMDTGGIGAALDDEFSEQIAAEVDIALETADLILFVADGREGLTTIDETVARQIMISGKAALMAVNKIDEAKNMNLAAEFTVLGFPHTLPISAAHGVGFPELVDALRQLLADLPLEEPAPTSTGRRRAIKVALVGCPNAGKSSLINAMLRDERTIVSDTAGTTRDSVDIPYRIGSTHYTLIDTAGMRRRTKIENSVELFSVMRAENSIRRADICALVIDLAKGMTAQDRRIARMIIEHHKPCIVAANKFDLYHPDGAHPDRIGQMQEEVGRELFFLHYAPIVAVSAMEKQFIGKVFREIEGVKKAARKEIHTGQLNRLIDIALKRNPPPLRHNVRLKILYAAHARDENSGPIPNPHYILFVNQKRLLTDDYRRYLERIVREYNPFPGLPIQFSIRGRKKKREQN